jgi:hypothetical protein
MESPGANKERQLPMLENGAIVSLIVLAPTVMAAAAEQGLNVQASAPLLLPAATTTVIPAAASSDHQSKSMKTEPSEQ